jgi:aromatic ring-opening dioxygenase catalytic subunit (LigB family)
MNMMKPDSNRLPVVFLPHGGGPFSYVDMGLPTAEVEGLVGYWRAVGAMPPTPPKALLVISAHWEARVPTVMTAQHPPILYDYYNFPPAAYEIRWPAPGDPALARQIRELLEGAGFATAADSGRGFDHGTFIPLGRAFPAADIPTVQLSLQAGLNPGDHLAMGRALSPLRSEGVFILGSGMSYHNMRAFSSPEANDDAETFDRWLRQTAAMPGAERDSRLVRWSKVSSATSKGPPSRQSLGTTHKRHAIALLDRRGTLVAPRRRTGLC